LKTTGKISRTSFLVIVLRSGCNTIRISRVGPQAMQQPEKNEVALITIEILLNPYEGNEYFQSVKQNPFGPFTIFS
jgi:hypothetical protein